MYYAIDEDGFTFEGTTLKSCLDKVEQEGSYHNDSLEEAIKQETILIFKGQKVNVKVIPTSYEEIVPPKVVKKPAVKPKRGK